MDLIINKAVQVLKDGGIISFPTDTVYGIGCDAYNQEAINRVYELKKRAISKPLILFIKDKSELNKYASELSEPGMKLINKFWPGKLTIIFKSKGRDSVYGVPTIGIRIPKCEPILTILKNYENPLATTSANLEGTPPPMSDVEMNITPDFTISGKCGSGIPSTIIDIVGTSRRLAPTLIREGEIRRSELEAVIGPMLYSQDFK